MAFFPLFLKNPDFSPFLGVESVFFFSFFFPSANQTETCACQPRTARDPTPQFTRVLKAYAEKLKVRAASAGKSLDDLKKKDASEVLAEYRCLCLIVNTAEYCSETVGPLGESVQRMLDVNLRDQVDAAETEDDFASLVTAALTTLVSGLESRTELVTGIAKINWGALEIVGDQSSYVDACSAALLAAVPRVHAAVSENYFRFFCEKFAGSVAPKVYGAIFRCKRFSDTGAQQLLLDVHAVKTLLLDLPTYTAARAESAGSGGGGGGGGAGGGAAQAASAARPKLTIIALIPALRASLARLPPGLQICGTETVFGSCMGAKASLAYP